MGADRRGARRGLFSRRAEDPAERATNGAAERATNGAAERTAKDGPAGSGASGSASTSDVGAARPGFEHLDPGQVYLDSACQTLRPRPVVDALQDYLLHYGACGGRVRYAWGRRVDEEVEATRARVLDTLGLSSRRYACAFTLNTTYGLNLLLNQLPARRYARVITTHAEHNAVFLSTIGFAQRTGIPRIVVERTADGHIDLGGVDLTDALVVVSAMDNVEGVVTRRMPELIADVHARGGAVILDAAQAAPHALAHLRGLAADAICFSAHKMYGPSLGVVAATHDLLLSLELTFLGGGQVSAVSEHGFTLLPEPHTRLEPGLQAWGEIIAFGTALDWMSRFRSARGETLEQHEARLSARLHDGLAALPRLQVLSPAASSVISVLPERVDGHRLATFLAKADISVRSGYFCAHHWLIERRGLDPLVRFSVGAHNTDADVDRTLEVMTLLMKGL